eukprot:356396-Chlamydomonas_euryale.AAC.13
MAAAACHAHGVVAAARHVQPAAAAHRLRPHAVKLGSTALHELACAHVAPNEPAWACMAHAVKLGTAAPHKWARMARAVHQWRCQVASPPPQRLAMPWVPDSAIRRRHRRRSLRPPHWRA